MMWELALYLFVCGALILALLLPLLALVSYAVDILDKVRTLFQKAGLDLVAQRRAEDQATIDRDVERVKLLGLYDATEHTSEMLKLDRRRKRVAISRDLAEDIYR